MSIKVLSSVGLTELVTKTKAWVRANFLSSSDTQATSTIDVDSTPTSGSTNLITSGAVYTADTSLSSQIAQKEATANKVTSISSSSTDTQYPSAKCVYDLVGNVETLLAALR